MHEPSSQNSTTEIQNMDERVSFLGSMIQSVTGLSLWIIDNNENILTGNDALSLSFSILKGVRQPFRPDAACCLQLLTGPAFRCF